MHHTKNFSKYPTRKKIWLVSALIGKFIVFAAVFAGLSRLLRDYTSPGISLALTHVILFACVLAVFLVHKRKNREDCDCEVK